MRDGFWLGGFWTLLSAFVLWLMISEIRSAKSKPWWVAVQGALIAIWLGGTVALIVVLPK